MEITINTLILHLPTLILTNGTNSMLLMVLSNKTDLLGTILQLLALNTLVLVHVLTKVLVTTNSSLVNPSSTNFSQAPFGELPFKLVMMLTEKATLKKFLT